MSKIFAILKGNLGEKISGEKKVKFSDDLFENFNLIEG